jgi:alanyl-tRNA synthetase
MDVRSLRRAYLEFFADRQHEIVPSASLIPHDPSILFTIAGMVPFKPYFLGDETPPWPRATSIQKCFRTVDIDIIGTTTRHCTFFEMLGNFSFGDYFKQGAIEMAWELLTGVFGIDGDRLWVTVHESDDDAEAIWRDEIGLDPGRIQRLGEDNFWRMGETGPCGPSSEIFFDKGPSYGEDGGPAHGGAERFVEIWNLVFMQFNRGADETLVDLPRTNIDTGAGLERLVAVLEGTDSIFATDVYAGLLDAAQSTTGKTYGRVAADDVALRILADHGRAMTMLVADGVLPSNEGRGYVLRRIVRRAVLAARRAGAAGAIVPALVAATTESLGGSYPTLHADGDLILGVLSREEEGFDRTLRTGMALLDDATAEQVAARSLVLPGDVAFRLHDTHGFPIELTEELVAEQALSVDRDEFDSLMAEQRERARAAARQPRAADEDAYRALLDTNGPTVFVGRRPEEYSVSAQILAVLDGGDGQVEIFLDRSPFYAEGGGQVGDTGVIEIASGKATILNTTAALPGLFAHRATITGEIIPGQEVVASIDGARREAIRRNHTATHLLHAALREVLGEHVRQQGSLVAPDRLRFDFSHHGAPTTEELATITRLVNNRIITDAPVETTETSRVEAESMGAIAFFGDKYGESVRVVRAGSHSLEFCGGTHVSALGAIGQIQIVAEGSIGSNTRRLEAVTGAAAVERSLSQAEALRGVAEQLKAEPEGLVEAVDRLLERAKAAERERDQLRQANLHSQANELAHGSTDGIVVTSLPSLSAEELRSIAGATQRAGALRAAVVGSVTDDKVAVAVATDGSVDAKALVAELGPLIGGGGGGSPTLAVAGGKKQSGLEAALSAAREVLASP